MYRSRPTERKLVFTSLRFFFVVVVDYKLQYFQKDFDIKERNHEGTNK